MSKNDFSIHMSHELDNDLNTDQLDLRFFEVGSGSKTEKVEDQAFQKKYKKVKSLLSFLFFGANTASSKGVKVDFEVLQAVLLKRDPEFSAAFRMAFNEGFINLYDQLSQSESLTERQLERIEMFISNALSLMVMGDLTEQEIVQFPQRIGDKWLLVNHTVSPIELTPKTGIKARFITEGSRVYAYGLPPLNAQGARSRLIFMGTHYPAGQGFWSQLSTDLKPFETPGEPLYRSGRHDILEWLEKQPDTGVDVCGLSLGGALSLLLSMDVEASKKLHRVDALNPPGLHQKPDVRQVNDKNFKVVVQCNENDLVSQVGYWDPSWLMYRVSLPDDKKPKDLLTPHAMNFVGFGATKFERLDPNVENKSRPLLNFFVYQLLRVIAYYLVVWPITYILRPLYMLIFDTIRALLMFSGKKDQGMGVVYLNQSLLRTDYTTTNTVPLDTNTTVTTDQDTTTNNTVPTDKDTIKNKTAFTDQDTATNHTESNDALKISL